MNLVTIQNMAEARPCIVQRLRELHDWSKALEAGRPLKLTRAIVAPAFPIFRSAAWHSATSGTLDHMPAEARIVYSNFYAGVENNQAYRKELLEGWRDLSPFGDEQTLTREDRLRIAHDINDIHHAASYLADNYKTWREVYARSLRIRAEDARLQPDDLAFRKATQAELCKPLIAQAG